MHIVRQTKKRDPNKKFFFTQYGIYIAENREEVERQIQKDRAWIKAFVSSPVIDVNVENKDAV